ncbi:Spy/CpxP family protein refolding chaperone [Amphritea japonica]|uniref:Periplasmic protein CpxP n=1 Tax=Amphritea japonica ATCC BAA-1530 TaxID=1278309 RepID=A0A7R6SRS4_9GAMM|nr:Spy/CpxP family protein refolding chaperone [Amphritea japonica]BBB24752.1 periplasmic protein CpxP [Amphritea japonica ATCC BAA-1530]
MRKQLIIGITAAIIGAGALTAGIASAKGDWERCGGGEGRHGKYEQMEGRHDMRMSRMADELELSDEQKSQMQALMKNKRAQMKDQRGGMRGMHNAFKDLEVNAADYDQQVAALVTQAQEKTAEMIQMRAQQKKAMFEILTPEQQEKYLEMRR